MEVSFLSSVVIRFPLLYALSSYSLRQAESHLLYFVCVRFFFSGVMLVGWGGNNGSTVTAGILANKHNIKWETKEGIKSPNYWGSLTQARSYFMFPDGRFGFRSRFSTNMRFARLLSKRRKSFTTSMFCVSMCVCVCACALLGHDHSHRQQQHYWKGSSRAVSPLAPSSSPE